jgi:hypothetical protein
MVDLSRPSAYCAFRGLGEPSFVIRARKKEKSDVRRAETVDLPASS